MKRRHEAKIVGNGAIEPAHSVEIVCAACGFDLDENELNADICSDCGTIEGLEDYAHQPYDGKIYWERK